MRIILAATLFLMAATLPAAGQKSVVTQDGIFPRDVEIRRIPRWQLENGIWEKYRRGEFDNIRLTSLNGNRYILSRTYAEEHRHQQGSYGTVPVFAFHYHTHYCGAVLNADVVEAMKNIQVGDTVMVQSRNMLLDYETEEFEEFAEAILEQGRTRRDMFFLWVCRTKNKRKDVIRIVDTGDVAGYSLFYWEIPYKTYMTLFE